MTACTAARAWRCAATAAGLANLAGALMLAVAVSGTVQVDGGSVAVALPETLDRLTLVLGTPGATAQLDAAAVSALRALLAEAEARMAAG